jgi:hypothetical protein
VFKQTAYVAGGNDEWGSFIIDRPTATDNLTSFKVLSPNHYFYQRRDDDGDDLGGPVSNTPVNTTSFVIASYYRREPSNNNYREGIYLNGNRDIDQSSPNGDFPAPMFRIGRHADQVDGGLNGYFAEMIAYDDDLTDTERARVQSYLAIKYGITLDASTNYVRRDGTVIYPSTSTHSGFVSDIAGIGRDNANSANSSALLQTNSISQNANSMVRISGATDLENNEFLLWGSNGGNVTTPNTSDVDGSSIKRRLDRVWRVCETGTDGVGNVTMAFDLSNVPGNKSSASLRLLIDRNGNGFSDNDRTPLPGSLAGNIFTVTVSNANLANGDRFTIGTTDVSTTPLPIELVSFNVTREDPAVVSTWQTASELNNDYFTLERAGLDLVFNAIGTTPGAGTTKTPQSYSMLDLNPYDGRSYYRLKQTDFDGTISYSETKTISIERSNKKLVVFPNPNDGKVFRFKWGNSLFDMKHVEVINQQGKTVLSKNIDSQTDLREYAVERKNSLLPGLYFIKVHYNGRQELLKLVVGK